MFSVADLAPTLVGLNVTLIVVEAPGTSVTGPANELPN
jgi:hypothetical protein